MKGCVPQTGLEIGTARSAGQRSYSFGLSECNMVKKTNESNKGKQIDFCTSNQMKINRRRHVFTVAAYLVEPLDKERCQFHKNLPIIDKLLHPPFGANASSYPDRRRTI